jgi:hypothetical protein
MKHCGSGEFTIFVSSDISQTGFKTEQTLTLGINTERAPRQSPQVQCEDQERRLMLTVNGGNNFSFQIFSPFSYNPVPQAIL